MPRSTGERLGPYEILAPIGAGGTGEVYKARDTRLDRSPVYCRRWHARNVEVIAFKELLEQHGHKFRTTGE
jgi:serine/threonine protein kinase